MRRRKVPSLLILLTATAVLTLGLSATALAAARTELEAQLTGANEVPPADPDGRGRAEVTLRLAEGAATGEVCFSLEFRRIGTPHLAHIHVGAAGQNGPPVVVLLDLVAAPRPATDPLHDSLERGRLRGCLDAPAATIQAIIANPAGYYVNIHNPRFPGGAIRGQLAND